MDFSTGVHDVICTRKIDIDRGGSRGQYFFLVYSTSFPPRSIPIFMVHITSCTPAEKAIHVLLFNQPNL